MDRSHPRHDPPLFEQAWLWGVDDEKETGTMLHCDTAKLEALRVFASLASCPHCGDLMIAPVASEFVAGDEIRHHWECEACGRPSSTTVPLRDD